MSTEGNLDSDLESLGSTWEQKELTFIDHLLYTRHSFKDVYKREPRL